MVYSSTSFIILITKLMKLLLYLHISCTSYTNPIAQDNFLKNLSTYSRKALLHTAVYYEAHTHYAQLFHPLEASKQFRLSISLKFCLAVILYFFHSIFEHCLCITAISSSPFWVKFPLASVGTDRATSEEGLTKDLSEISNRSVRVG